MFHSILEKGKCELLSCPKFKLKYDQEFLNVLAAGPSCFETILGDHLMNVVNKTKQVVKENKKTSSILFTVTQNVSK